MRNDRIRSFVLAAVLVAVYRSYSWITSLLHRIVESSVRNTNAKNEERCDTLLPSTNVNIFSLVFSR